MQLSSLQLWPLTRWCTQEQVTASIDQRSPAKTGIELPTSIMAWSPGQHNQRIPVGHRAAVSSIMIDSKEIKSHVHALLALALNKYVFHKSCQFMQT